MPQPLKFPKSQLDRRPRVLLVDDDHIMCDAIAETLQLGVRESHTDQIRPIASHVTTALGLHEAMGLINSHVPDNFPWDVIIADVHLGTDYGIDLLREVRGRSIPVAFVLITGRAMPEDYLSAIRYGVDDMLLKPFSPNMLRESITRSFGRIEETRSRVDQLRRYSEDVHDMRSRLADTSQNSIRIENTVVESLLEALEIREPGSYMHSLRVQAYTVYFAHAVGYPDSLLPQLERAAILHDIGKIGLADKLLFKPDGMTPSEHERTHTHTILGEQILSRIPFLRSSALIVRQHHEQFNGSGYPDGVTGDAISLGARIFSMMDSLDSMTTDRPYRSALSFNHACIEIQNCAGTQFDPRLCERFAQIPPAVWQEIRQKVEQRRLTKVPTEAGAVPQLSIRN